MAEIVDIETVEPESVEGQETQEVHPDIPEKLRGKSLDDLSRMYLEAEKTMTKSTQEAAEARREAAELRRYNDMLLKSQTETKAIEEAPKTVDFFENPQEAMRQAVESNPMVLDAKYQTELMRKERAKEELFRKHPDAMDYVKDDGFLNWVKDSPIRTQLFRQADAYDIVAADELFGTYKQLKTARNGVEQAAEDKARDDTLKAVGVDSGGAGEGSRKTYRRADLINLKMRNPQKYAAMEDDILLAYSEGRVR